MSVIQKLEISKKRSVCIELAVGLRLSTAWKYPVIYAISHLDLNLNYNIIYLGESCIPSVGKKSFLWTLYLIQIIRL